MTALLQQIWRETRRWLLVFVPMAGLLAGCTTPIGADRVTTRQAYAQIRANALLTGKPSAPTVAILNRYNLDCPAARQPEEVVRQLHHEAVVTGDRDLLFALAEMSYVAGDYIRRSARPWDSRDARDYYLGSAVYAWLFMFGQGEEARPGFLDRRAREAGDFYNYGLGLGLAERESTNGVVLLQGGRRRLPVGRIDLELTLTNFPTPLENVERILLADQFRVRGLSVRNREPGVGAPLLMVQQFNPELGVRRCSPATVFLRLPRSLAELDAGTNAASLELYSAFGADSVTIGASQVPLAKDLTTHLAYVLNESSIWKLGMREFLVPQKGVRSQLIPLNTFRADRIPVVFVHGTFASPITWAEMNNTLAADPVLRRHYQIWTFVYGSGNSLAVSAAELRDALTAQIHALDPQGTNALLRQMVVIGHSQGGLLTKLTATVTGDKIWRAISDTPLAEFPIDEDQRANLHRLLFLEPLPFVHRVIFISTPHRGSYRASGFVRRLARKLISLPRTAIHVGQDAVARVKGSNAELFLRGRLPSSLDSMSPKNPVLLALADIPVAPGIHAHSIIPVKRAGNLQRGRDGVVAYTSAHVDYVESELVVRGGHSCQGMPASVQEVRRILHEQLDSLDFGPTGARKESNHAR